MDHGGPLGTILPPRAALTPSHPTSPLAPPAGAGCPGHDSGGGCLPAPSWAASAPTAQSPRPESPQALGTEREGADWEAGAQTHTPKKWPLGLGARWAPPSLTAHQHPRPRPLVSAWVARVTETPPAGPTACQSPGPLKDPALWTAAARPLRARVWPWGQERPPLHVRGHREREGAARGAGRVKLLHTRGLVLRGAPQVFPPCRSLAGRAATWTPNPAPTPPGATQSVRLGESKLPFISIECTSQGPHLYRDRPAEGTWDSLHSAPSGIPPGPEASREEGRGFPR